MTDSEVDRGVCVQKYTQEIDDSKITEEKGERDTSCSESTVAKKRSISTGGRSKVVVGKNAHASHDSQISRRYD